MRNVLERLINLLVMLLTASRPVPADEIRRTIPGYSADSDDAFHRMFERDKELLRGIGIPIELTPTFPEQADLVLLTQSAKQDPAIVRRIKTQLVAGKSVVITSGLLRALDLVEVNPILDDRNTTAVLGAELALSALGQKII